MESIQRQKYAASGDLPLHVRHIHRAVFGHTWRRLSTGNPFHFTLVICLRVDLIKNICVYIKNKKQIRYSLIKVHMYFPRIK